MNKLIDAVEEQKAHDKYETAKAIERADSDTLIAELYSRGYSYEAIFAQYYEMEQAENGRLLTVADAELVS